MDREPGAHLACIPSSNSHAGLCHRNMEYPELEGTDEIIESSSWPCTGHNPILSLGTIPCGAWAVPSGRMDYGSTRSTQQHCEGFLLLNTLLHPASLYSRCQES